jgi:hypothetical protein
MLSLWNETGEKRSDWTRYNQKEGGADEEPGGAVEIAEAIAAYVEKKVEI